jgi:hypothetical protein
MMVVIIVGTCFVETSKAQPKRPAMMLTNPDTLVVNPLPQLNSKCRETNICISPDGKWMLFMSDRPSSWSTKDYAGVKGRYDGDIWFSFRSGIGGQWQQAMNIGRSINTPMGEDEPNISPEAQTLYFQSWRPKWDSTEGPYYYAELHGLKLGKVRGMGSGIAQFFRDTHFATDGATLSSDGKLFIVASGKEYLGAMDIYISRKQENGEWAYPIALSINTPYDERSPFLAADGRTLYFGSTGYEGLGRMDIYKTVMQDDGIWSDPINIGAPFNTQGDDYGFVVTASGSDVYLVHDGDICFVDTRSVVAAFKPIPTIILMGKVRDRTTQHPIETEIKLVDAKTKRTITTARSNSTTGDYLFVLQRGKKYNLVVAAEGYFSYSKSLSIPGKTQSSEYRHDIDLQPMGRGSAEGQTHSGR